MDRGDNFQVSFLSSNDAEKLTKYEPIEETLIIENKEELIYEKENDFYCSTRLEDDTFVHRKLGKGYGKLMNTLGFPGYKSDSSTTDQDTTPFPLPDVSYEHEWFWPHISYTQAETLLNNRQENLVVIRMSQSKPGHFALTAGRL